MVKRQESASAVVPVLDVMQYAISVQPMGFAASSVFKYVFKRARSSMGFRTWELYDFGRGA
jgi:hypothetical protein